MNDPVENLLRQMSLKKPSRDLDDRIAELIVERRLQLQLDSNRASRWSWLALLGTAASFLALGITSGLLIGARMQPAADETQANSADVREVGSEEKGNEEVVDVKPVSTDSADSRTRFVEGRLVRNADGELQRAYRTLTPKRYLLFDTETKSFYDLEVELPRVVVTTPPEI